MIRQVSVDDRLLHGQVAFYWTSYYNLDMILVLNDEAANDEFTKMILGLAKPPFPRKLRDDKIRG